MFDLLLFITFADDSARGTASRNDSDLCSENSCRKYYQVVLCKLPSFKSGSHLFYFSQGSQRFALK